MEDTKIVDQFLERDESVIRTVSEKYGKRLYSLAYSIVLEHQTAEECENDTYLQAWNYIPPNEPRTYLYAFLARITRHISLNRCREQHRLKRSLYVTELSEELEQCIESPNDTECYLEELELKKAINDFLRQLSEEKRNLFIRRYWYLDSIADLSKRFLLSESKVKTTLFRLRNELRDYLLKEGYRL